MWRFRFILQNHLRIVCIENVKMTSKKVAINEKPKVKTGGFRRSESVMPPGINIRKPSSAAISSNDAIPSSSNELDSNVKEGTKVFRRSSMICSEGFDKYTYDCHKHDAPNPSTQPESDLNVRNTTTRNAIEKSAVEQNLTNRNVIEMNLAQRNVVENNLAERSLVERDVHERRALVDRNLIGMNMTDKNFNERNVTDRNILEKNLTQRSPVEINVSNRNLVERNLIDRNMVNRRSSAEISHMEKKLSNRNSIERNKADLIDRNMVDRRSSAEISHMEKKLSNRNSVERNRTERNLIDKSMAERRLIEQRMAEMNLSNRTLAQRNIMDMNMAERNLIDKNMAGRSLMDRNMVDRNMVERRSLAERNMVERQRLTERSPVEMNVSNKNLPKRNLLERNMVERMSIGEQLPVEKNISNKNLVERNMAERRSLAELSPVKMNASNRNLVERNMAERRSLVEHNPIEMNKSNRDLMEKSLVGKEMPVRKGFMDANIANRSITERNFIGRNMNERNSVQMGMVNKNLPERVIAERSSLAERNIAQRSFIEMNKTNRSLDEMNMINRSLDEVIMNKKSLGEMNMANRNLVERRSLADRSLAEKNMSDRRSLVERNMPDRRSLEEKNMAGKGLSNSNMVERNLTEKTNVTKDILIPNSPTKPTSILKKKTVSIKSPLVKRDSVVHPGRIDMQPSLCISGRFQNPWPTWRPPSFTNILKFGLSKDKSKVPPKQELDLVLPIVKQNFSKLQIPDDGIRVTWMGHSTVLVQMHGLNVLTDPMFSDRASPSQVVGPKRYRDPPCSIHDLPHINAVVISHSHYDHLDLNTVILLNARFGTDIRWFVPLGLQSWMQQVGCENVVELDWWEENCVPEHSDTFFVFTPAQHWSKRTIADDNKVLWGSWCILGPKYRFFFAGDTGYCDVFKQIGRVHGPFDLSAIPIGAYEPRWFMKYQHINPEEAVQIHLDVRSKRSLAVHWGTFCLANEYYLDPPRKLRDSLDKQEISPEFFFTLKHGESRLIAQNNLVKRDNSQVINNYKK